jgi:hypothetical protein
MGETWAARPRSVLGEALRSPAGIVGAVFFYVAGALVHGLTVNVDEHRYDQDTYLQGARLLRESLFSYVTNRVQMPVYPHLLALLATPGISDAQLFLRAKLFNIGLSLLLLGALHVRLRDRLGAEERRLFLVMAAATVFVFRAPYVQAELLFYTFFFLAFLAWWDFWTAPSWKHALGGGTWVALAHLTKGSILPGFAFFLGLVSLRSCARWFHASGPGRWKAARELGACFGMVLVFGLLTFPYLRTSNELFGSYFFNLSSQYVMYCDSWEDFLARVASLGDWIHWVRLHDPRVPSLLHYWQQHSLAEMLQREGLGLGEMFGNALISHGYVEPLAILGWFAWKSSDARSRRTETIPAFVMPLLAIYVLLFGFYGPITASNRFLLTLYLPTSFTLWVLVSTPKPITVRWGERTITRDHLMAFLQLTLLLHVVFRAPVYLLRWVLGG